MLTAGIVIATVPSRVHADPPPTLQLRQMIIRAPEEALLDTLARKADDDTLAQTLLEWLEKGKAKVVSDVSTLAAPGSEFEAKDGKAYRWVTENDQEFDHPILTATAWQDVLIGTSLTGAYSAEQVQAKAQQVHPNDPFSGGSIDVDLFTGANCPLALTWNTEFRPKMPLKVRWPLVWPENKKPEVNWYEQDDFLVQRIESTARLRPGRSTVLAIMRPAADLETEPPARELDVVLVQTNSSKAPASTSTSPAPATARVMLLGFGVKEPEALELLTIRDPNNDAALLVKLEAMAREGKAARRVVCAAQTGRTHIQSVRDHSHPTEMPTIPSAWNERAVGTILQMDTVGRTIHLELEHHPARFRLAEWICALDAPELIMWQPQFFVQQVQTTFEFPACNVVLAAAMRTPDCLKGSDKGPVIGETLLVFAQLDQPAGISQRKSPPQDPPIAQVDLEAIILDLPAAEAADWSTVEGDDPADDELRYQKALAKVKDGTASIACHLTAACSSSQRSIVKSVEEVNYVTEYNAVDHNPTGRYRPTALERVPVGSMWEVDFAGVYNLPGAFNVPALQFHHTLHHDALPASQPTLKEAMKFTQDHPNELPIPVFTVDEWRGSMNLLAGKARCLGALRPNGARYQNRIHVAFLRGVVRK
jgi:hypothetical protein